MKNLLYQVLNAATDKPLFFAYQNGVKLPPEPYITIYVIGANSGMPSHKSVFDDDGKRQIEAHRPAHVQLDCYGANSYDILDEMVQKLQTQAVIDLSASLNVAITHNDKIKALPTSKDDSQWQDRSSLTITFSYVSGVSETLPIIEKANITGEYQNG